ncbi:MAG TPA: F0F1 ATP synthase subunit delta [Candidatus Paceibacterota bacterium]|nr:F0F1 ATP synthase subunit delta [Candidatus Paceibacterota bacterium]
MIDNYTRLLEAVATLEDTKVADAAVTKLIAHLKSSGRMKMLPEIARELRKVAARRLALAAKVEVAHEKEVAQALKEAAEAGISARHAKVNHALIQGWRAREGGKLVDRSAKRALIDIYQKVTA